MVYSLPYSFGPGEVARPQEVNANFNSIANKLEEINTTKADIDLSNITSDGIDNIKNSSLSKIIGELVFSPIPLNSSGLHLLDGSILSPEGIYSDFCAFIRDLYNEDSSANYFTTESDWQTSVTQYGSCGKFVYNEVNNTVRLPKISDILQGTTDTSALGDLIEAGLPNITGYRRTDALDPTNIGGCFYTSQNESSGAASGESSFWRQGTFNFDASRSSSIYGNSSTVQPQTVKVLYYIVVANSYKTEIQVDIDEIATDLNGKADVDLINTNNQAKILMASMGMPSNTVTSLSTGTSNTTYTAPANGYFNVQLTTGSNSGNTMSHVERSDGLRLFGTSSNYANGGVLMPVLKGQKIKVWYQSNVTFSKIYFIYAKGSESEAS